MMTKKGLSVGLAITAISLLGGVADAQMYGDEYRDHSAFGRMQNKLGRGLANMATGFVEVPTNRAEEGAA